MHFAQIISAALALPALGMAAVVQRATSCSNYNVLSIGALYVNTFHLSTVDSVIVQIRAPDSGEAGWNTIATVSKGVFPEIDVASRPGFYNLRVCDSLAYPAGGFCVYPSGVNKLWNFKNTGDRWPFTVTLQNYVETGVFRQFKSACDVQDTIKVTSVPTSVLSPTSSSVPSTTSIKASTSTSTTSNIRTSTSSSRSSTTTRTSTRASTTSTKASTTTTSTRTSTSSRASSTTTRRN